MLLNLTKQSRFKTTVSRYPLIKSLTGIFFCFLYTIGIAPLEAQVNELSSSFNSAKITAPDSIPFYRLTTALEKNLALGLTDTLSNISTLMPLRPKNAPGTVTIFNREDIEALGALDLKDILSYVPGLQIGTDIAGMPVLGVRGNQGSESILLLVDGIVMNELLYGTIHLQNTLPIQQIERVEVVRGGGTSLYGSYACYAVINVQTKASTAFNGISVGNTLGFMGSGEGRSLFSAAYGIHQRDLSGTVAIAINRGINSDATYRDIYGKEVALDKASFSYSRMFSTALRYKRLSIQMLGNVAEFKQQSNHVRALSRPYKNDFLNLGGQLRYTIPVSSTVTVVPYVSYLKTDSWKNLEAINSVDSGNQLNYHKPVNRVEAGVLANNSINSRISWALGANIFRDESTAKLPGMVFYNGNKNLGFTNHAVFAQAHVKAQVVNLLVGLRLENNSYYGTTLAPRVGLSRSVGIANFKTTVSRSYRAPGLETINAHGTDGILMPQYNDCVDAEVTLSKGPHQFTLTGFYNKTGDGIIVSKDRAGKENTINTSPFHTIGAEAIAKFVFPKAKLTLTGSYYTNNNKTTVYYCVPNKSQNLAFSPLLLTAQATIPLAPGLFLNASSNFIGERYGIIGDYSYYDFIYKRFKPRLNTNLFLTYRLSIAEGLSISAGVRNLSNTEETYIQPYCGLHNAMPGSGRKYLLSVTYDLSN
jgi:outer membrane cobalamin receptor